MCAASSCHIICVSVGACMCALECQPVGCTGGVVSCVQPLAVLSLVPTDMHVVACAQCQPGGGAGGIVLRVRPLAVLSLAPTYVRVVTCAECQPGGGAGGVVPGVQPQAVQCPSGGGLSVLHQ